MNPAQARNGAALLVARPRYGGLWLDTGCHWTPQATAGLEVLCAAGIGLEKAADALGRSPTSIAHRARDTGLVLPSEWAKVVRPKRQRVASPPRVKLAYPYIVKMRDEHADLVAVNRLVAQYLPGREDICQEVMLALWEGRVTLRELEMNRNNLRPFVRRFMSANFEQGGAAVSLDAPIRRNHDGGDLYLQDVLSDEDHRERMAFLEREAEGVERYPTLAPFGRAPIPPSRQKA